MATPKASAVSNRSAGLRAIACITTSAMPVGTAAATSAMGVASSFIWRSTVAKEPPSSG
jgi:hypothetical protein